MTEAEFAASLSDKLLAKVTLETRYGWLWVCVPEVGFSQRLMVAADDYPTSMIWGEARRVETSYRDHMVRIAQGAVESGLPLWTAGLAPYKLTSPVVPYVRMTQRSKWVDPQAIRYLEAKHALAQEMLVARVNAKAKLVDREPFRVAMVFGEVRHNCDLDNQAKAVLDAGNGILWEDDRWCDAVHGIRRTGEGLLLWVGLDK